jgi:hypothetical protein
VLKTICIKAQSTLLTMGVKTTETYWDTIDWIHHCLLHLVGHVLIRLSRMYGQTKLKFFKNIQLLWIFLIVYTLCKHPKPDYQIFKTLGIIRSVIKPQLVQKRTVIKISKILAWHILAFGFEACLWGVQRFVKKVGPQTKWRNNERIQDRTCVRVHGQTRTELERSCQ